MKSSLQREAAGLARYGVVGGVNTIISFAVYAGLIKLTSLPFWAANAFGMAVSIAAGFVLASRFVFGGRLTPLTLLKYTVAILSQLAVSTLVIGACVRLGLSELVGWVIALPPSIAWSFGLQRWWVFRG